MINTCFHYALSRQETAREKKGREDERLVSVFLFYTLAALKIRNAFKNALKTPKPGGHNQ
jgi:hypothetical protein